MVLKSKPYTLLEHENFSVLNYIQYLSKSNRESLNKYFNFFGINDLSDYQNKINDGFSTIEATDSLENLKDQTLKQLASNDLIYEIEKTAENIELTADEFKLYQKGQDAFLSLLMIIVDQSSKDNIPIEFKIDRLNFVINLINTYFLYNLNNDMPYELQRLIDQIDKEMDSLYVQFENKRLIDYFPFDDILIFNQFISRLVEEGYLDKFGKKEIPNLSDYSEFKIGVDKFNWTKSLQLLVYLAYLVYNKSNVYKGDSIFDILSLLLTVKGECIEKTKAQRRWSDILPLSLESPPRFPKSWNKISDLFQDFNV